MFERRYGGGDHVCGSAPELSFDRGLIVAALRYHLQDQVGTDPTSFAWAFKRLSQCDIHANVSRAQWAEFSDGQRLKWLLHVTQYGNVEDVDSVRPRSKAKGF